MNCGINVIIDARMVDKNLHGIARYTYELIKNARKFNEIQFILLVNDEDMAKKVFKDIDGLKYITMKSKFLSLYEQVELPRILNKYKGLNYIFHSPSFVNSPFIKIPTVMTIHDLNHIRFPQFYTPFHKYYYEYIVKSSANKAKKLLTVSNFSKGELISWLKCDADKVKVTYNGIDDSFKVVKDIDKINKIKSKYGLPNKFLLYVGNQKPHKNVETLVKAIELVEDKELHLVLNGKPSENILKVMNKKSISDKVKFIGFVDDNDLSTLYSMADIFIFPSLYEGFGLPPLEAMACGCPTIVSNTSSLPEVVGQRGITFSVTDIFDLSSKINLIAKNDKLSDELKVYGIERAKEFRWDKLSRETIEIYKEVLEVEVKI